MHITHNIDGANGGANGLQRISTWKPNPDSSLNPSPNPNPDHGPYPEPNPTNPKLNPLHKPNPNPKPIRNFNRNRSPLGSILLPINNNGYTHLDR